jgi:hypothetical protein
MIKKNRGGKRKGAGRPKLGRDKLLTVRLSSATIDRLGRRPALRVRHLLEKIYGTENSAPYRVMLQPIKSELDKVLDLQDVLAGDY